MAAEVAVRTQGQINPTTLSEPIETHPPLPIQSNVEESKQDNIVNVKTEQEDPIKQPNEEVTITITNHEIISTKQEEHKVNEHKDIKEPKEEP